MRKDALAVFSLLALGILWALGQEPKGLPYGAPTREQVLRGRYLVVSMDCAGCHGGTPDPANPGWLAGYDPKTNPQGAFQVGPIKAYAPNLTPDPETGLGQWPPQAIFRALREGKDVEGHALCPPMPWPAFRYLNDQDLWAIVAYLVSLKPVKHAVPDPEDARNPGMHADCSFFYKDLNPLPISPYPTPNEEEVR